jgi:hypothetical protein
MTILAACNNSTSLPTAMPPSTLTYTPEPTNTPAPTNTPEPTNTPTFTPIPPTIEPSPAPFTTEELAANGTFTYRPPDIPSDDPCWVPRFQSPRGLTFEFLNETMLIFDPSFYFFNGDIKVPVVVEMSKVSHNTWTGIFSGSIEPMRFSVKEEVTFESDGILWHEFINDENPGYYSNTVECGPSFWTRLP